MNNQRPTLDHEFRYPAEIISYAVWFCHCFSLSIRDVEISLVQREVGVSYDSIRV